jgi:predicted Zn-dependent protease
MKKNANASSIQHMAMSFLTARAGAYFTIAMVLFAGMWIFTPVSDWATDFVVDQIPISRDVELGAAAVKAARYKIVHDSFGVKELGQKLTKTLPADLQKNYRFQFEVIEDKEVNAWAYPGGFIFVTTGLLKTMKLTKHELAGVIGHEIGHVVSRHSQKEVIKQSVLSWILSAFIREDNDGVKETFGENIHEMLVDQASKMTALAFSRKDEYEADERGVSYLQKAGMSPQGMISFFDKLMKLEYPNGKAGHGIETHVSWFSTHPGTEERIQTLKEKFKI